MHRSALAPMVRMDLLNLRQQRRFVGIFLAIAVVSTWASGSQQGLVTVMVFALMLPLNLLQIDQNARLPMLYGGLPLRRRTVIASHYVVAAMMLASTAVAGVALVGVDAVTGRGAWTEGLGSVGGTVLFLTLALAIMLPLALRFGTQTASLILMAGTAVLILLVTAVPTVRDRLSGAAAWLAPLPPAWGVAMGAIVMVGALVASYLVSVRIYEGQDH